MIAAGLLFLSVLYLQALGRPTVFTSTHDNDHVHDTLRVHERRAEVPQGFAYVAKAAPDAMLDLRLALVQGDPKGLEAALYDVSTPGNANYRKHLSKAQVRVVTSSTSS